MPYYVAVLLRAFCRAANSLCFDLMAIKNHIAESYSTLFRNQTFLFMHLILIRMQCMQVVKILWSLLTTI